MKKNNLVLILLLATFGIGLVSTSAHARYCTTDEWANAVDELKSASANTNDKTCQTILKDALRTLKKEIMPTISQSGNLLKFPNGQRLDISKGYNPGVIDVVGVLGNSPALRACLQ